MRHFILTRFNLLLWNKDKEGKMVRTESWSEHRFDLFERYCLPSIIGQTCQHFQWIVLFDSTTPEKFKERIAEYQKKCSQLIPVFVKPEKGRFFAQVFKQEVENRFLSVQEFKCSKSSSRVLTTYLDNDDALNERFVEDIQRRAEEMPDRTFIAYDNGYQLFTDYNYMMRIRYPRNHFMSVVESAESATLKTIYGYGSHYYVEKIEGTRVEHVKKLPMWCEVIHEKNMGNDAYFLLGARMVKEAKGFGFMCQDSCFKYGFGIYLFRFLPRYLRTFVRRIGYRLFGRHW